MLRRSLCCAVRLPTPCVTAIARYSNSALQATGVDTGLQKKTATEEISRVAGVPSEYYQRTVRIFSPAKNAMQSGTYGTHHWRLEWPTEERWENPLMGWCSTADMHSNTCIEFDTKEQAILFCERQGYFYEVDERQAPKKRPKSYSENFHYSKRTRIGNK